MPAPLPVLLAPLLACSPGALEVGATVEALADPVTVLDANWSWDGGRSWVEYGEDGAFDHASRVEEPGSGRHGLLLLGMPADTDVSWRLVVEDGGGTVTAARGTTRTGELPADLAEVVLDPPGAFEGYLVGAYSAPESGDPVSAAFVLDAQGRYVWYHLSDPDHELNEAMPVPGGLLVDQFDRMHGGDDGWIEQLDWAGNQTWRADAPGGHHFFDRLDDGTVAWLAVDVRDTEGHGAVVGDRVVETAPDGSSRTLFSVWDAVPFDRPPGWDGGNYYQQLGADWSHGNSVRYDPDRDSFLVSFGHLDLVTEIAREDGELLSMLGGRSSDLPFEPEDSAFDLQHGPHWIAPGRLLTTTRVDQVETWAVEYEVSDALRPVWSYGAGEGLLAGAEGEARRLENGDTLVNWGKNEPRAREVTESGQVLWEARFRQGVILGQTRMVQDLASWQ